jgi:hypothetical protein
MKDCYFLIKALTLGADAGSEGQHNNCDERQHGSRGARRSPWRRLSTERYPIADVEMLLVVHCMHVVDLSDSNRNNAAIVVWTGNDESLGSPERLRVRAICISPRMYQTASLPYPLNRACTRPRSVRNGKQIFHSIHSQLGHVILCWRCRCHCRCRSRASRRYWRSDSLRRKRA